MLQISHLHKAYHQQKVLDIPSLSLTKGLYWLNGTNGSGKTTFLKILSGLLPYKGEVLLNGINLRQQPVVYRRLISWAEAEPLYPAFLTGEKLLLFYTAIQKPHRQKIEELLSMFEMQSFIHNPIGSYSAGMVKKLSLVLALMGNAQLILLDEPLITLDAAMVELLCQYIIRQQGAQSFIISSHQVPQNELFAITKQLIVQYQTILPA